MIELILLGVACLDVLAGLFDSEALHLSFVVGSSVALSLVATLRSGVLTLPDFILIDTARLV